MLLNCVARDQAGILSGALDAMEAACRVAAPLSGGILLETGAKESPLAFGVVLCILGGVAFNAIPSQKAKKA